MNPIAVSIHAKAKPWLAASNDPSRTNLRTVRILPNGAALASEGHVAVYLEDYMAHATPGNKALPDLTFDSETLGKAIRACKTRDNFGRIPAIIEDGVGGGTRAGLKLGADVFIQQWGEQPQMMRVMTQNDPTGIDLYAAPPRAVEIRGLGGKATLTVRSPDPAERPVSSPYFNRPQSLLCRC